jgi:phage baseplate assembly protein W
MAKKQYFGIKYPFTNSSFENYEFDLNRNEKDRVASELLHLLFTPKGQRLRMPEYGTDLIQYIFEPNDTTAWEGVKSEIQNVVSMWIQNVTLNDIQVMAQEDGREIYVRIDYSVKDGNNSYKNSIAVEL